MIPISGTLYWDTTVINNPGWLLESDDLVDGAPCVPSPNYYDTAEDASEDTLRTLIESTLRWEGYKVENLTMEANADSQAYAWTADVRS